MVPAVNVVMAEVVPVPVAPVDQLNVYEGAGVTEMEITPVDCELHATLVTCCATTGAGDCVRVTAAPPTHPLASVTDTLYNPAISPVADVVLVLTTEPVVAGLQVKEKGEAPVVVNVAAPVLPLKQTMLVEAAKVTVGDNGGVNALVKFCVQEPLVTPNVYVPALILFKQLVVLVVVAHNKE